MVVGPFGLTTRHVTSCSKNYVTLSNLNIVESWRIVTKCVTLSDPNIAESWRIVAKIV